MLRSDFGKLLNIASAATTVVKVGPGALIALTLNEDNAGAITLYDNTSAAGTVLATIAIGEGAKTLNYQGRFSTGLTIVTAAADDITVSFI